MDDLKKSIDFLMGEVRTLRSECSALRTRADNTDAENADLKAQVEALKAKATEELMLKYASRWRGLLFVGGTISSAFAIYGYLKNDERWSWAAGTFWGFSIACLFGAMVGNPKNIHSWKEKFFIGICGILFGLGPFFGGLQFVTIQNHQPTLYLGWFGVVGGIIFMIIFPPAFIGGLTILSNLSDNQVSKAIKTIFKSLPQIIGSTLFVSAASVRCLMKTNLENPVLETCGNPTMPSIWVSVFLMVTWFLGYIIPPLLTGRKTMTWTDVMVIRMNKVEGTQFFLFGSTATIALLFFAYTDENGGDFDSVLQVLTVGYLSTTGALLLLVLYDAVVKPLIWSSDVRGDGGGDGYLDDKDSFNVNDTGSLSIGSV